MALADGPSLLWRLGLKGLAGLPWTQVHQHASVHFPDGSNAFGEIHLAMVAAAARDKPALDGSAERLEKLAAGGNHGARAAQAWVAALQAMIEDKAEDADRFFERCEQQAVRLGGSNAQRNIIAETRAARLIPTPPSQ